jgi:hypothetical protein
LRARVNNGICGKLHQSYVTTFGDCLAQSQTSKRPCESRAHTSLGSFVRST